MSDSGGRPWILAEATWPEVRSRIPEVAILPWGATEPHNLHLPYGTDVVEAAAVAEEAAARAWRSGAPVMVLPTVPFGVQTGQLDLPLAVNMNPSTQAAVLGDVADSLDAQGVPKLVVLNGHGGNDFKGIVRELQPHVDVFLCALDWWRCVDAARWFDEPGDHAGELETSVMMHVAPDLVRPLDQAGSGNARAWRIAAFREGWAWAPRPWTAVTDDTGVGDPSAATPERGAGFFDAAAERIAGFLVELASADLDDMFA